MQNVVPKMSRTPCESRWAGRPRGFDNAQWLGDYLGLGEEELAILRSDRVI
jgi:hypothetical protein